MDIEINTFFKEVTVRICGTLDIKKAVNDLLPFLNEYMPVDALSLAYLDIDGNQFQEFADVKRKESELSETTWFMGSTPVYKSQSMTGYTMDQNFMNMAKKILKEKEDKDVFILNRFEQVPGELFQYMPDLEFSSLICLKQLLSKQRMGLLTLIAKGHDRYSQKHASLLKSVKDPVSIALSNTQLFQEVLQMKQNLADDNRALIADLKKSVSEEVVGANFGLRRVMEMVRQVASTDSPVLLLGETGTGKEVIANAIHATSPRNQAPMISMQCGAVPETLLDSELFGHEKGAFTGAIAKKRGRFERADNATLFLDEIGELSPDAQVKLLRVLQENQFERVGGTQTIQVNARVIAATHRDLEKMVREGKFREDLWYRLNMIPILIPPLRSRKEDILSLIQYFIKRKARKLGFDHIPEVDHPTLEYLKSYDWPGNVRELENVVERALIMSKNGRMVFPELNVHPAPQSKNRNRRQGDDHGNTFLSPNDIVPMDQATVMHICRALNASRGKISGKGGAAELLEMNESTLRFRMKKLGIGKFDGFI